MTTRDYRYNNSYIQEKQLWINRMERIERVTSADLDGLIVGSVAIADSFHLDLRFGNGWSFNHFRIGMIRSPGTGQGSRPGPVASRRRSRCRWARWIDGSRNIHQLIKEIVLFSLISSSINQSYQNTDSAGSAGDRRAGVALRWPALNPLMMGASRSMLTTLSWLPVNCGRNRFEEEEKRHIGPSVGTHHVAVVFENVHFAHWASSVFKKPRIDADFMELVPVEDRKKDMVNI